jgi:hypothetical protein
MLEHAQYLLKVYRDVGFHRCPPDPEVHNSETAVIELIHYDQSQFGDLMEFYQSAIDFEALWYVVFNWPQNQLVVRVEHPETPAQFISDCPREMLMSLYESMSRYGELEVVVGLDTGDDVAVVLGVELPMDQVYYQPDETAVLETKAWMSRN